MGHEEERTRRVRSPVAPTTRYALTLCASLVQNPANLGALCRTAEVFGLEQLVLPSLSVVQVNEFRKLAVSAYQWQPLAACAPEDLSAWIEQCQHHGAEVVALTRHRRAIALPDFRFQPRTALVLGRELTGIPEALVAQCDRIVAIPQFGRLESLNVHTAAAIAAYAYITQYRRSLPDRPSHD